MKNNQFLAILIALTLTACAGSPPTETAEATDSAAATDSVTTSVAPENPAVEDSEAFAADEPATDPDWADETDAELEAEIMAEVEAQGGYAIPGTYDPFEGFNRVMWDLNYDYLDPYIARPVSLAYVDYVPSPLRTAIRNFLANLGEPASMLNSLLMQDGEQAVTHFNRFWINSTFGLAGLIDIASAADINQPRDRAFGDSMGYYGVSNGPFFMVPLYGPVTLREGAGDLVDGLYFPLNLLTFWQGLGKWALEGMEDRAALVSQEAALRDSPDPYIFTRDAYIQHKNFRASRGELELEQPEDEEFLEEFMGEIDEF